MASVVYQTLQYICTFFILRRDSSCRTSENMAIGDGCYISIAQESDCLFFHKSQQHLIRGRTFERIFKSTSILSYKSWSLYIIWST